MTVEYGTPEVDSTITVNIPVSGKVDGSAGPMELAGQASVEFATWSDGEESVTIAVRGWPLKKDGTRAKNRRQMVRLYRTERGYEHVFVELERIARETLGQIDPVNTMPLCDMALCDVGDDCPNASVDVVGGEVYYCADHEDQALVTYGEWQRSPERAARMAGEIDAP